MFLASAGAGHGRGFLRGPAFKPRPDHPGGDRAFVPASRQKTSKNDIKTTMKEIPDNTAGAIVLTGHLRAKRPGESVRNAGAFIVAQGMLTPGALAEIIKRDGGCPSESRAGRRVDGPVRGCLWEMRRWKRWRCSGRGECFTVWCSLVSAVPKEELGTRRKCFNETFSRESAVTEREGRLEK